MCVVKGKVVLRVVLGIVNDILVGGRAWRREWRREWFIYEYRKALRDIVRQSMPAIGQMCIREIYIAGLDSSTSGGLSIPHYDFRRWFASQLRVSRVQYHTLHRFR